jgi:hypothetical protein
MNVKNFYQLLWKKLLKSITFIILQNSRYILNIYSYYELSSEILSSVRKMEESIQRLKRVRELSKTLPTMTQSMTTSSTTTLTDDNKIRMQIQNDVNAFTSEVINLYFSLIF